VPSSAASCANCGSTEVRVSTVMVIDEFRNIACTTFMSTRRRQASRLEEFREQPQPALHRRSVNGRA
jgi:hypothetical protein